MRLQTTTNKVQREQTLQQKTQTSKRPQRTVFSLFVVVMFACSLVSVEAVQYVTLVMQVFARAFLYSTVVNFISNCFPGKNFSGVRRRRGFVFAVALSNHTCRYSLSFGFLSSSIWNSSSIECANAFLSCFVNLQV